MIKKSVMYFVVLVFLVPFVFSAGVCELDKFNYHPGETSSFICGCTSPLEENVLGDMVWVNSSGFVLLNESGVSSGSCRTSIFGSQYVFLAGQNFTGNVTFVTGSGAWDDVGDVVGDDFNVTGPHEVDCIISVTTGASEFILGELGVVRITVIDALSEHPLVHANCIAEGYTVNQTPIVVEPYGIEHTAIETFSLGETIFMHEMVELFWEPDTDYLFEFHCYCLPVGNDEECFSEVNGSSMGFKACTVQFPFRTSSIDNRFNGDFISVVIGFAVIIFVFGLMGFLSDSNVGAFTGYGVALIETVFLGAVLFVSARSGQIIALLRLNFYLLLLLGFAIGIISLFIFALYILNPGNRVEPENPYKKFV